MNVPKKTKAVLVIAVIIILLLLPVSYALIKEIRYQTEAKKAAPAQNSDKK
jgi:CHASE3 domain sensor protein